MANGATANRKFFKLSADEPELPYKTNNVYALDEERLVYFIRDVPHLLTTTRNCLLHSTTMFKPRTMQKKQDLLWSNVSEAYMTAMETKYRISWRLTHEHIFLSPRSLMNVHLAAQVGDKVHIVGEKATEKVKFIRHK